MSSHFPFTAIDTSLFSDRYAVGRQRWLAQVAQLPGHYRHISYPCAGLGPEGDALLTDTVWIGAEDATKVLVLIAGTHGVEGFAGNAVEIDLLRLMAQEQIVIPANAAVLMVHALTPWGYAWRRRCDADGVDLNRNVVDFAQPLPENPGYEQLRPALFLFDIRQRQAAFADFTRQYGREAFESAISAGQYTDPVGPFYGGRAPAHGRLVTEALLSQYALSQRDLAVIDLHTGLGPFGYGEIICDHTPDSAGAAVARRWYGGSVTLPLLGTSTSVPKLGLLDFAWHRIMNAHSCYVTLEFGTYRTLELFEVLLQDHLLWAQADNIPARIAHSQLMLEHFCPNDVAWQEMVLVRARQVFTQALRGL
jgi:predicted deacylase